MGLTARILLRYLLGYLVFINVLPKEISDAIQSDPEIVTLVALGLSAGIEFLTAVARRLGWKT